MRARIQKWGNSLAVRIPKAFAQQLGMAQDSEIEVELGDSELVIRPAGATYTLRDLVAEIRPETRHDEVATGDPIGREVW